MYSALEKKTWGLGPIVENVSLVADKKRLLALPQKTKSAVLTEAVANSI